MAIANCTAWCHKSQVASAEAGKAGNEKPMTACCCTNREHMPAAIPRKVHAARTQDTTCMLPPCLAVTALHLHLLLLRKPVVTAWDHMCAGRWLLSSAMDPNALVVHAPAQGLALIHCPTVKPPSEKTLQHDTHARLASHKSTTMLQFCMYNDPAGALCMARLPTTRTLQHPPSRLQPGCLVKTAPQTNPECPAAGNWRAPAEQQLSAAAGRPQAKLHGSHGNQQHHCCCTTTNTCPHPLQGRQQCTQGPRLLHCSQQVVPAAAAAAHSSKTGCTDCSSCLAGQSTASLYAGCMIRSYSGARVGTPGDRCCATRKHADQHPCPRAF